MKKLWAILLAVLLVTGFTLTGCGEEPEPTEELTLEGSWPTAGDPDNVDFRIGGTDGYLGEFTITSIEISFIGITLWSLEDWFTNEKTKGDYVGGNILTYVGNPTYTKDEDNKVIKVTGRAANYEGLQVNITDLGYAGFPATIKVVIEAPSGTAWEVQTNKYDKIAVGAVP